METLKQPCNDCPFRRQSLPGWLGPWAAQDLLATLKYSQFPCHQTIKVEGCSFDNPDLKMCAGAAIYMNNKLERSRDPYMAAAQNDVESVAAEIKASVFKSTNEFLDHHEQFDFDEEEEEDEDAA